MLALLYGFDFVYGMTFALGGKAESPSQLWLKSYNASAMNIWGSILAVSAVVAWLGWGERGGLLCLIAWALMTVASVETIVSGKADSWGGPLIFGLLMGMHVITVYGISSGRALVEPRTDQGV